MINMNKNALTVYALIVCFASTILGAIVIVESIYSLVGVKYPHITINQAEFDNALNNLDPFGLSPDNEKVPYPMLSEKVKDNVVSRRTNIALNIEKRKSLQKLVGSLVTLLVALLVFIPHWLIARRYYKNKSIAT